MSLDAMCLDIRLLEVSKGQLGNSLQSSKF